MKSIPLDSLKDELKNGVDYFICSSSFEERSTAVLMAAGSEFVSKKAFVFFVRDVKDYLEYSERQFIEELGGKLEFVEISFRHYVETADKVLSVLEGIVESAEGDSPRVLVDVSTFTHELLLLVLWGLKKYSSMLSATLVYVNVDEYDTSTKEPEGKWLSRGLLNLHSVFGYAGDMIPSKSNRLIVIVGYEYERALSVIDLLEPNFVSLAYGKPDESTAAKHQSANEHFARLLKEMTQTTYNPDLIELPCNDPWKSRQIILDHVAPHIDKENIMIIPMNNKLTTIGAALAAFEDSRIQLCYGPAAVYNFGAYSRTGSRCYVIESLFDDMC